MHAKKRHGMNQSTPTGSIFVQDVRAFAVPNPSAYCLLRYDIIEKRDFLSWLNM